MIFQKWTFLKNFKKFGISTILRYQKFDLSIYSKDFAIIMRRKGPELEVSQIKTNMLVQVC